MKRLTTFCLFLMISLFAYGQSTLKVVENVKSVSTFKNDYLRSRSTQKIIPNNKGGLCDIDTLKYARYKSTNNRFININDTNSASGMGQFVLARDSVTIYGANIYAYTSFLNPAQQGTVNVYFANSQKLPVGLPLASQSVSIPSTFSVFPINLIKQTVIFTTPITTTYDFVVTFESTTTAGISYATSEWENNDGRNKGFSLVKINGNWLNGLSVNITSTAGTFNFDADPYIEPIVQYKAKSGWGEVGTSCLGNGKPFKFFNESTPLLFDVYNPLSLDKKNGVSFAWDYGDGSPLDSVVNGENNYPTAGISSYNVKLTSSFTGWTMTSTCEDTYEGIISKPNLKADFSASISEGTANFNNNSVDGKVWFWDFGDGYTDTVKSPKHTYALPGLYTVNLIAFNKGCIDTAKSIIQIKTTGIGELSDERINIYPNPSGEVVNVDLQQSYDEELVINIYSMIGELVGTYSYQEVKVENIIKMDVSQLASGRYFIKMSNPATTDNYFSSSFMKK